MARLPITEKRCVEIIDLPKYIREDVSWALKPNKSWSIAKVTVENNARLKLELILTINNEELSKFSFTLLLNGIHRIRGLDVGGSHTNKCSDNRRWNCETHKHSWNDACPGGGHAYSPADITGTKLGEIFTQFCDECNIQFEGEFNPAPIQKQMKGI